MPQKDRRVNCVAMKAGQIAKSKYDTGLRMKSHFVMITYILCKPTESVSGFACFNSKSNDFFSSIKFGEE